MRALLVTGQLSFALGFTRKEQKEFNQLIAGLERSFKRHAHIQKYGSGDPTWHDGVNLNLVRNHIFWYRREIANLCNAKLMPLPDIARRPVPQKYPLDYCVRCKPAHVRGGNSNAT